MKNKRIEPIYTSTFLGEKWAPTELPATDINKYLKKYIQKHGKWPEPNTPEWDEFNKMYDTDLFRRMYKDIGPPPDNPEEYEKHYKNVTDEVWKKAKVDWSIKQKSWMANHVKSNSKIRRCSQCKKLKLYGIRYEPGDVCLECRSSEKKGKKRPDREGKIDELVRVIRGIKIPTGYGQLVLRIDDKYKIVSYHVEK